MDLVFALPAGGNGFVWTANVTSDRVAIVLAAGRSKVSQDGTSIEIEPGEWTVARGGRPLTIEAAAPTRTVIVPLLHLPERGLMLRQAFLRRFSAADPSNRLAHTVLGALFDEAPALRPGEGADLAQAALHVLKNALAKADAYRHPKAVLADRVREFIECHIRDPALTPEGVARGLRCTPRHIHRAFEGGPESVGQYILRRRLEHCRDDLADARLRSRSVTQIAFSWGFNNAAHFSRVFKRQFGSCPRSCRHGG